MATSTIFNFNFNNSEIVDSTGQWYNATTGTPTTEFINHDGNTALFQPAETNGRLITPNPTVLRSYDPNFKAYTYTLEVQVCAVLNRTHNSSFILNFPVDETGIASALGLWYNDNRSLEMWIDYASEGYIIHPVLIDFNTAGFDRWFSVRIERTVDPNNPYIGATVKAYVDGTEVYNQTFTYDQSTIRGMIGPRLRYCENREATGGIAIDNLKLTAGIAPSSVVDVSLANLQRNNANLLSFIKGKVSASVVNDGTLTIQRNGTNVATFTANQSTAATANITVPTAVSELTNDLGYLTSSSNLDASKLTSGTVDIERLPQGALERLVKVANTAARYALTIADVQLGDTVQQLDTGIMYIVTDADHLDSAAGYTEYTAGTAASVPWSGVTGKPTFAAVATSGAYSDLTGTPTIPTVNNGTLTIQKNGTNVATFTANASTNATANITVPTKTSELTNDSGFITSDDTKIPLSGSNAISGSLIPATDNSIDIGSSAKNIKMLYTNGITIDGTQFLPSDYIPRSGGAVMTGSALARDVNSSSFLIAGGTQWNKGSSISLTGMDYTGNKGSITFTVHNGTSFKQMELYPDGTWTWNGTACQITSDQRLKQQISQIDDALLDAWEDVELSQFKYNDAVKEKSDNARLHTGYVVQQIDTACKSHNVDISKYGLYCHEEYPEETEEVEIEQKDGTKTKERKVIREASEHYSLRYTEALIVECKYLRRCIARLTARIEELEKGKEQEAGK